MASLVSVMLPSFAPESEFFQSQNWLASLFQLGCMFLELYESAVLDRHLKLTVRFRKES